MTTPAASTNPALPLLDRIEEAEPRGASPVTLQDLDALIASQRRYIRYYLAFALAIAALGIVLVLVIYLAFGQILPDALKSLFGVGCGFISSLSALQVKELLSRKDKEAMLLLLKQRLLNSDPSERQRIEKLVQEAVQKTILG
jgi:hypothetical protein